MALWGDAHATYVHTLVHKHMRALRAGMQMCAYKHAHGHTHAHVHLCAQPPPIHTHMKTPGHTEEIGKIGICFDDSTGQIKHMNIINVLEDV